MTKEVSISNFAEKLQPFLPMYTAEYVARFIIDNRVHFTVSKSRKSKLGDYRMAHDGKPHRISVNGDLNKYAFLVTTLHEMAHLETFKNFGWKVKPHGEEWKSTFKKMVAPVFELNVLPEDVRLALTNYLKNAKASSCGDERLYRVLRRYDKGEQLLLEHLSLGDQFEINGRSFIRGQRLRKRFECVEVDTRKKYRILGVAEVKKIENK